METTFGRLIFRLVGVLAFVVVATGCTSNADATESDGGPPPPVFCTSDSDCSEGLNCTYPIDVGCTALGECRDMTPPADMDDCTPAGPACACDGTTIQVPACWNSLAQKAVQSEGACGTSDAGAKDAAAD